MDVSFLIRVILIMGVSLIMDAKNIKAATLKMNVSPI